MSANRAGSANSVRGLSGGSVLWQPTIAEKRRTDEQTSTQKPFGGVLGQERNFGIHLYGRHEARWKTENLMPKNSRQEACAVKAYWCPFQCFRIESTTYFDPTSASQFNDKSTVAPRDAVDIPRRGGNHFDGNKSPTLRLASTMHTLTIFIQRPYSQATLLAKRRPRQSTRFKLRNKDLNLGQTTSSVLHSHFAHSSSATLNTAQEQSALLGRIRRMWLLTERRT